MGGGLGARQFHQEISTRQVSSHERITAMQSTESPSLQQMLLPYIPNLQDVTTEEDLLKIKTINGIVREDTLNGLYQIINIVESSSDSIREVQFNNISFANIEIKNVFSHH